MLLMVSVVPSEVCTLSSVSVTQSSLALLLYTGTMYVRWPLNGIGGEKHALLQASNLADGRVILLDIGNDGGESRVVDVNPERGQVGCAACGYVGDDVRDALVAACGLGAGTSQPAVYWLDEGGVAGDGKAVDGEA